MNNKFKSYPKVAVILPVYNVERYLPECIESLTRQTYQNFVVFAVDDGSKDRSGELLDEYSKSVPNLRIFHQKNGGVSSARNTALEKIEADDSFDYISFVDSDDVVTPVFLEHFVTTATNNNADYVVCGVESFTKNGAITPKETEAAYITLDNSAIANQYFGLREWVKQSSTKARFLSNKFFKCECVKGKRFDTKLASGEDEVFFISLIPNLHTGVCIKNQNYRYRLRASSLTRTEKSSPYSVKVFYNFLQDSSYCKSALVGIERELLDCWWSETRRSYTNKDETGKLICKEMYSNLMKYHFSEALPKKYKRRFAFFSLGDLFMKIYFYLRSNKKRNKISTAYFD